MTHAEIFQVIKNSIQEILFDLDIDLDSISMDQSLKDLGANSIDRMDILVETIEALGLKIPLVEFGKIANLQGLVNFLYEKKQELS